MKKRIAILCLLLAFVLAVPMLAWANMGPPISTNPAGGGLTFAKNDNIKILGETLTFDLTKNERNVTADYKMKNTSDENVSILVAFPLPVYGSNTDNDFSVQVNGKEISVQTKFFARHDPWEESAIYNDEYLQKMLENITEESAPSTDNEGYLNVFVAYYTLEFQPQESINVVINYTAEPSAYHTVAYQYKHVYIYYLSPASNWKDFEGIRIVIKLNDGNDKYLLDSNLEFEFDKETNTYVYESDTLPNTELRFTTYYNRRISKLEPAAIRMFFIITFAYFWYIWLFVIVAIVVTIVCIVRYKKKLKAKALAHQTQTTDEVDKNGSKDNK